MNKLLQLLAFLAFASLFGQSPLRSQSTRLNLVKALPPSCHQNRCSFSPITSPSNLQTAVKEAVFSTRYPDFPPGVFIERGKNAKEISFGHFDPDILQKMKRAFVELDAYVDTVPPPEIEIHLAIYEMTETAFTNMDIGIHGIDEADNIARVNPRSALLSEAAFEAATSGYGSMFSTQRVKLVLDLERNKGNAWKLDETTMHGPAGEWIGHDEPKALNIQASTKVLEQDFGLHFGAQADLNGANNDHISLNGLNFSYGIEVDLNERDRQQFPGILRFNVPSLSLVSGVPRIIRGKKIKNRERFNNTLLPWQLGFKWTDEDTRIVVSITATARSFGDLVKAPKLVKAVKKEDIKNVGDQNSFAEQLKGARFEVQALTQQAFGQQIRMKIDPLKYATQNTFGHRLNIEIDGDGYDDERQSASNVNQLFGDGFQFPGFDLKEPTYNDPMELELVVEFHPEYKIYENWEGVYKGTFELLYSPSNREVVVNGLKLRERRHKRLDKTIKVPLSELEQYRD